MLPIVPEEISESENSDPELDDENADENNFFENEDEVNIMDLNQGFEELSMQQWDEEVSLPKHQRCAAHTLNLVATADLRNIPGWTHKKTYNKALRKCHNLWRKQNMSSSVSAKIKAELGHKLKYPTKIRWNSHYDSMMCLSNIFQNEDKEKMCKLHMLMDTIPGLEPFTTQDIAIINEYCEVMSPVAQALDILQGEKYAYTGGLLPTIYSVQVTLQDMKDR